MKKIPTLFKRDPETNLKYVTSEVNPGCEWVLDGEGTPTRKFDGTCCLVREGVLLKRREFKDGKPVPVDFEEEDYDPITGKHFGWVPLDPNDKGDRWYFEAFAGTEPDGTYELCGPKVQGNPEEFTKHVLVRHGREEIVGLPRDFDGLRAWLSESDFEGIVWHHPDGRMVKLKRRDFPRHNDGEVCDLAHVDEVDRAQCLGRHIDGSGDA